MQKQEMNRLAGGKVMATIFHDRYLASMLMGMIVCGIAIVILLVTIGILYV